MESLGFFYSKYVVEIFFVENFLIEKFFDRKFFECQNFENQFSPRENFIFFQIFFSELEYNPIIQKTHLEVYNPLI